MLISVFDTSICDNNLGNQIIMESVNQVIDRLFPDAFLIRLPYLDSIGAEAVRYVRESDYTFFGGTNALSSEMETYRQWGLTPENSQAINDVILLGVGWWQYQGEISPYTRHILTSSLHPNFKHSVRDSYTRDKLATLGFNNVLVTGCPTLWSLTEQHCANIPLKQAENVLLTFTNYSQDERDRQLLATLQRKYRKIFLWVQGPEDLAYARSLSNDIDIIPPSLNALDRLLSSGIKIDYVGTRLHAGIRAMAFGHRTIIIGVDNRATEMGKDFNLPVLSRNNLDALEGLIERSFPTEVMLPYGAIQEWQEQFASGACTTLPQKMYVNNTKIDLPRVEPISRKFGIDRGTPIDRYYIERFLEENSHVIRGTVLEIGDNAYTTKFGSNVQRSEILNAVPSESATIVGDLASGLNIPSNAFDAIILTQTLHVIYDIKATVQNAYRALKPGGSLLITAPGISQISRYDMDRWGDFWRFTNKSLQMLVEEMAPAADIDVSVYGNVAVAKAFLDGVSLEEFPADALDYQDDDFQVLLSARVTKPKQGMDLKPLVLIYHRVADLELDPQLLCVSPDNFDAHLQELAKNYHVIPLFQMLEECANGSVSPDSVSITFDDGYLDNLTNALPLLERHGLHATIFVTSGMVGSDEEFWWDALERIFLTGISLPKELPFAGRVWQLHTAEDRLAACDDICALLRELMPEALEESLHVIYSWAGTSPKGRDSHRAVDFQQIQQLASSKYVEIGAHAKHHVRLACLSAHRQRIEVTTSKQQLEALVNKPVRLFSYPFGSSADFTFETIQAVAAAGYQAAIANIQGEITLPLDQYAVPRRLVRNWCQRDFSDWMRSADKGALEAVTVQGRKSSILQHMNTRAANWKL